MKHILVGRLALAAAFLTIGAIVTRDAFALCYIDSYEGREPGAHQGEKCDGQACTTEDGCSWAVNNYDDWTQLSTCVGSLYVYPPNPVPVCADDWALCRYNIDYAGIGGCEGDINGYTWTYIASCGYPM